MKCNKCGKDTPKRNSRCSRCQKVFYCSRDCQIQDWTQHRPACTKPGQDKEEKAEKKAAKAEIKRLKKLAKEDDDKLTSNQHCSINKIQEGLLIDPKGTDEVNI